MADADIIDAIGTASSVDDLALRWLYLDPRARLIVDREMNILWTNEVADGELARRRDIEADGRALRTVNRGLQRTLESFVGACTGELASWNLPRCDGDGHLIIRAQRLSTADDMVVGCTYGLLFFGGGSDFEPRYADLGLIFRLTATERRVLDEMIGGNDATAAAAALDISVETVRSHIRHIYTKMRVNSREKLFAKLRPYRL